MAQRAYIVRIMPFLQYMKYVLAEKSETPIPYSEQNNAARKDGVNGSHNYLLTEVANKITDYRKVKNFKESFRDLKDARVKADYSITLFSVEEGVEYKEKACRLISNLNTFFTKK